MFVKAIFKKLGWKRKPRLMALAYGIFYFIFALFVFFLSTFIIENVDLQRSFVFSLFIGVMMFFVFFIKHEAIKLYKQ
jgi:hypothetical protein